MLWFKCYMSSVMLSCVSIDYARSRATINAISRRVLQHKASYARRARDARARVARARVTDAFSRVCNEIGIIKYGR